jgi:Tfp pilus assembly protein PilF
MQYRRALELAPNDADVHTGYGVLLAGRQQLDEAVAEFQRALAVNPLHYEARFDLARVLEQQGKTGAARIEYERVAAAEEAGPVRQAARQRLAAKGR